MGRGRRWRRKRQDWLTRDLDNAEFTLKLTRWLAARWSRHEFDVGSVLLDYARRLTEAGRREEALAALNESIQIGNKHIQEKPLRYAPNMAAALLTKAHLLADLNRVDEALSAVSGAVDIFRTLTPTDPDRFEPVLFAALTSLGFWRHQRGDLDAAMPAFRDAAALAPKLPATRDGDRAMALHNYGAVLHKLGQSAEGLPFIEKAVTIRRRLVKEDRDRFERDLVLSLRNLEQALSAVGRYVEAIEVIEELSAMGRRSSPATESDSGSA
ncbi:tetratricopeptide repeat protein [Actinophytocola glycyrrhizae]|uniref:Tetratricopeptide repeat protein n=1 Tax=Actinophytocola glycyrrhizae TaxID=2044873 RepID=A0ABV9S147_9PSEU